MWKKHRSNKYKKSLLLQSNCIGPTCVRGCRIKFVVTWRFRYTVRIALGLLMKRVRNLQAWVDCSACRFFRLHRPLWSSVPEQICISSSTWGLAPWQTCIPKIGHLLYTNRHILIYLLTRGNIVSGESNNQLSSSLNSEKKSEIKTVTMPWPLIWV